MKIKHSKLRNTGLIFELLVKQIAADTQRKQQTAANSSTWQQAAAENSK